MEFEFNVEIKDGGMFFVLLNFFIISGIEINLSGSLVGVLDLMIINNGWFVFIYFGYIGFRIIF